MQQSSPRMLDVVVLWFKPQLLGYLDAQFTVLNKYPVMCHSRSMLVAKAVFLLCR